MVNEFKQPILMKATEEYAYAIPGQSDQCEQCNDGEEYYIEALCRDLDCSRGRYLASLDK